MVKKLQIISKAQLTNKDVFLEYDEEQEDQYGRTLAYLCLDKDTMFNEELIKKVWLKKNIMHLMVNTEMYLKKLNNKP